MAENKIITDLRSSMKASGSEKASAGLAKSKETQAGIQKKLDMFNERDALIKKAGGNFRRLKGADQARELEIRNTFNAADDRQFEGFRRQFRQDKQSQINAQAGFQGEIDAGGNLSKQDQSVLSGAQFGAGVLGEEGLGRLGTDTEVQETLGRFKDVADKGLSRGEVAAERAQAFRGIESNTQTGMRSLQGRLAKMGVKGAVAGQQLIQREIQGAQQKSDIEQNLFLKSEQVKREGLKDFSQRQGAVKTFDLGQSAKEKDIILQSGLGFAQVGSAERVAKFAAERSKEASIASARASNSGGGGMTVVCTELHRQNLIPYEIYIKNVKFGIELAKTKPHTFEGYLSWGMPVAKVMKSSKIATFFLAPVMKRWVNYIGGNKSIVNIIVFKSLFVVCGLLGKMVKSSNLIKA